MTEENLICEIVVPEYPRVVVQSAKIKEKHFIKEELKREIPLKYCDSVIYKHTGERIVDTSKYLWIPKTVVRKGKKTLVHILQDIDGNKIISNSKSSGKQKFKIINGSDLFRLNLPIYTMTKIKNELKSAFLKALKDVDVIEEYPIIVKAELFDTIIDQYGDNDWDMDNRFVFYGKYFMDCLAGLKEIDNKTKTTKYNAKRIIKDDNRLYVTSPPSVIFTPIKNEKDRKLVFRIYKDTRKEIEDLKYYRNETTVLNFIQPRHFNNLVFFL